MGWKGLLMFLSVAILLGLTGWGIHARLDAVLAQHEDEARAVYQAVPADPAPRPPILQPQEQGRIWELLIPAIDGIQAVNPDHVIALERKMAPNFDAHGTPADTPRLVELAGPALERCRRAAHRSDSSWTGALPPEFPLQAACAVRLLCSKALLCWRAHQDAAAVEWLVVALTVAYDASKLSGSIELLQVSEYWALADFNSMLSEHSLTAAQLDELARQLERLRSARPSFVNRLRIAGAEERLRVLKEDVLVYQQGPSALAGELSRMVGWREFYSVRYARARILGDLRSCGRQLEGVSWLDPAAAVTEAQRIVDAYQGHLVYQGNPLLTPFLEERAELMALDFLAIAVGCARYQAEHGRLPKTWEESGVRHPLAQQMRLFDEIVLMPSWPSTLPATIVDLPREWVLRRR